jgi:hypothetical protein
MYVANFHGMARFKSSSRIGHYRDKLTPQRNVHYLEARLLLEDVINSGKPVILTGDFNFNSTYKEHAFFKQLFGDATTDALKFSVSAGLYTGELSTFSPKNPWARKQNLPDEGVLDYVFISAAQVTDAWIDHPDPAFSDHWPLTACVDVKPSAEPPMCMPNHRVRKLGIGLAQVESLIHYFKKVEVPTACKVLGESDLVKQREHALALLKRVRERVVHEGNVATR